jgi:hypothetical protein
LERKTYFTDRLDLFDPGDQLVRVTEGPGT